MRFVVYVTHELFLKRNCLFQIVFCEFFIWMSSTEMKEEAEKATEIKIG